MRPGRVVDHGGDPVEQGGQAAGLGEQAGQRRDTGQRAEGAVLVDDGHLVPVAVLVRGEAHGEVLSAGERGGGDRGRGGRSGH
nr:hypothetical protein [Streptomyces ipomoeae]